MSQISGQNNVEAIDSEITKLRKELAAAVLMAQIFHSDKSANDLRKLMDSIREGLSNQESINILIDRFGERAAREMDFAEGLVLITNRKHRCKACGIELKKGEKAFSGGGKWICMFCSYVGFLYQLRKSIQVLKDFYNNISLP